MKKNDTLKAKILKPKKQTIDFLLGFSKGIEVMMLKNKSFIITKN